MDLDLALHSCTSLTQTPLLLLVHFTLSLPSPVPLTYIFLPVEVHAFTSSSGPTLFSSSSFYLLISLLFLSGIRLNLIFLWSCFYSSCHITTPSLEHSAPHLYLYSVGKLIILTPTPQYSWIHSTSQQVHSPLIIPAHHFNTS